MVKTRVQLESAVLALGKTTHSSQATSNHAAAMYDKGSLVSSLV